MGWFPNKQERDAIDERQLSPGLRERQLAARRIPAWLRIAILVPCVAAAVYFIATFSGPFRYIAELESTLLGGRYHPQLAGLLTVMVCMLPAIPVVAILRKLFPPTAEELARPPRATARVK